MGRAPTNVKEKLIETAIDLVWRSSYGHVSVEDICKAAGAQKGSFYYYFESKADLALAALEAHFAHSRPELEATFCLTLSPMERLERMADLMMAKQVRARDRYGRVCGCPFATLGAEVAGQEEKIRARTDEIINIYIGHIEQMLMDGIAAGQMPVTMDVQAKAREINGYLIGLMTMARILNSLDVLRDIKGGILSILGTEEHRPARSLEEV
jgi:TetR/AcrR family transcriptional regulator, transcriptional repressor for nem operon